MSDIRTAERFAPYQLPLPLRSLALCLQEARPSVQVIFLLRFAAAYLLAAGVSAGSLAALPLPAFAWLCATFYVYLVNGVHDAPEDRVNGSGRPIGRGALPPRTARRVARAAALLAVAAAVFCPQPVLFTALVVVHLAAGHLYSAPPFALKRNSLGAIAVVLVLGGATFAAAWVSAGAAGRGVHVAVIGAALTLWMGLVGALVKDLSDRRGDTEAGRRTAVIVWGERRTRAVCAVNPVLLGALFVAAALALAPELLAAACVMLAGGIATAALTLTTHSAEPRHRSRLPYRAFMLTQYGVCVTQLGQVLAV
ncbi:UbiA family prenyltransferase [Streptomyces monticola]|uniref:UbiA family prenyltransferase n=1 Tax=Streptomyces monticola TaxID=2666263 RepID=A0ABW2JFJ1_9ACTN